MEMESSTRTSDLPWIDQVIADIKDDQVSSHLLNSLAVGETQDFFNLCKQLENSGYEQALVEFDGNYGSKGDDQLQADQERRMPLLNFYCRAEPDEGFVGKVTDFEECSTLIRLSIVNIAVKATLKVDGGKDEEVLLGAVTFRISSKIRFIPILEIAVNVPVGLNLQAKELFGVLLLLMRMVHTHLCILPVMKEMEDHLKPDDLRELLDVYPCSFLSKEHDGGLLDIFAQLGFVQWPKGTNYFFDRTITSEGNLKLKDGSHYLVLRKGEFVSFVCLFVCLFVGVKVKLHLMFTDVCFVKRYQWLQQKQNL